MFTVFTDEYLLYVDVTYICTSIIIVYVKSKSMHLSALKINQDSQKHIFCEYDKCKIFEFIFRILPRTSNRAQKFLIADELTLKVNSVLLMSVKLKYKNNTV